MAEDDGSRAESYFERVYALVATVPEGRVVTYGQVARALGVTRGSRAVGYALRALEEPVGVPWWRVVNASGGISLRQGHGAEIQREMLEAEGVSFLLDGRAKLAEHRFEFITG